MSSYQLFGITTHESPCSKNMKQYKRLTFNQLTDNDILKYLKCILLFKLFNFSYGHMVLHL